MTIGIQRTAFVGLGVGWNRRSAFDYGWVTLMMPFCELIVEWSPDNEEWERRYG